jgi:hypothetical protein
MQRYTPFTKHRHLFTYKLQATKTTIQQKQNENICSRTSSPTVCPQGCRGPFLPVLVLPRALAQSVIRHERQPLIIFARAKIYELRGPEINILRCVESYGVPFIVWPHQQRFRLRSISKPPQIDRQQYIYNETTTTSTLIIYHARRNSQYSPCQVRTAIRFTLSHDCFAR